MKSSNNFFLTGVLSVLFILGLATSCQKKGETSSEYVQSLSDIASVYNKKCPKEEANGTRLESVTFAGNTMTFRMSLTDAAITMINLEETRDSIIHNMSDKLKKFLVKGRCNLEYKYVSPNDSSSITIVPNELGYSDAKDK